MVDKKEGNIPVFGIAIGLIVIIGLVILFNPFGSGDTYPDNKLVIDYFYSETCSACITQKPDLEKFVSDYNASVILRKRCIVIHEEDAKLCENTVGKEEHEEAKELAIKKQVSATPSFFFNGEGVVGVQSYDNFVKAMCLKIKVNKPKVCD